MRKKIIATFLTLFLAIGLFGCVTPENELPEEKEQEQNVEEESPKTILYLGDSIAEAVAGPSPITERETYGYYGILGTINGFDFFNRAVSGYQTGDLLAYVNRSDDGVQMVQSLVSAADIIHISIIGNDILGYDINRMLVEAASDSFGTEDARLKIAYDNIDGVLKKIREVNPEAIVVMQTVYNPIGENSPLINTRSKLQLASKAYTPQDYHRISDKVIRRMNDVLYRYMDDHTEKNIFGKVSYRPYYLADVYSAFEKVYENNFSRWETLFCEDGIHPTNEGHAIIAEVNQALFEEIGIASEDALQNYKNLRCEQLKRLYDGIVSISPVVKTIGDCDMMRDVRLAYFDATNGKDVNYKSTLTYEGDHFDEMKIFGIRHFLFDDADLMNIPVPYKELETLFPNGLNIFSSSSEIILGDDGTFEMRLTTVKGIKNTLQTLVNWGIMSLPINLTEIIDLDINYLQSTYLARMFPGFDYGNLLSSVDLLQKTIGLSIEGLALDSQAGREMANKLAATGNLILTDLDVLENDEPFAIVLKSSYHIREITSELTGKTYTAVYVGQEFYHGESYLRFTYDEENKSLRLLVDVVDAVIEGEEY